MSKDIILVTSGNKPDVKKNIASQITGNWGANSGLSSKALLTVGKRGVHVLH